MTFDSSAHPAIRHQQLKNWPSDFLVQPQGHHLSDLNCVCVLRKADFQDSVLSLEVYLEVKQETFHVGVMIDNFELHLLPQSH